MNFMNIYYYYVFIHLSNTRLNLLLSENMLSEPHFSYTYLSQTCLPQKQPILLHVVCSIFFDIVQPISSQAFLKDFYSISLTQQFFLATFSAEFLLEYLAVLVFFDLFMLVGYLLCLWTTYLFVFLLKYSFVSIFCLNFKNTLIHFSLKFLAIIIIFLISNLNVKKKKYYLN